MSDVSCALAWNIMFSWNQRHYKWKNPCKQQSLRPLCNPHLGRSLFSLRGRVIYISVSRFLSWELETPKEGHGHSGGAADTESQSLSHVIVFHCVGPSLRGCYTCCLLCSALLPIAACWPPALLLSLGIFFRNHPLTPLSSIQEIMNRLFQSTACTRYPKHPSHFLFLLFLFPTLWAVP